MKQLHFILFYISKVRDIPDINKIIFVPILHVNQVNGVTGDETLIRTSEDNINNKGSLEETYEQYYSNATYMSAFVHISEHISGL